jgi:hypothetical protein
MDIQARLAKILDEMQVFKSNIAQNLK